MKARTLSALGLGLGLMMASLPLLAGENWLVYQRGPRLSLAIDRASLATQADGLLHFVHEERYAREMYEKKMDVRFFIRRTRVAVDCNKDLYAFTRSDYLDKERKPVFSGMFDIQRHAWQFLEVSADSMGEAMVTTACTLINHPAYSLSTKP